MEYITCHPSTPIFATIGVIILLFGGLVLFLWVVCYFHDLYEYVENINEVVMELKKRKKK